MTIEAYVYPTPNSYKVLLALELLGLDYNINKIDLAKGEQLQGDYAKVNPACLCPTIKDSELTLGESLNILEYLVATHDKEGKYTISKDSSDYWKFNQFLIAYASGLSVYHDKIFTLSIFTPDQVKAIGFLKKLLDRKYALIEAQLAANGSGYLFGENVTIADLLAYPHTRVAHLQGVDFEKFPKVKEWRDKISSESFVKATYEKLQSRV